MAISEDDTRAALQAVSEPVARGEIVIHDAGGWISGPSISLEDVFAAEVTAGDRLLFDNGVMADVTRVRNGLFWLPDGAGQSVLSLGVSIKWSESGGGNVRGTLIQPPGGMLYRVTGRSR